MRGEVGGSEGSDWVVGGRRLGFGRGGGVGVGWGREGEGRTLRTYKEIPNAHATINAK